MQKSRYCIKTQIPSNWMECPRKASGLVNYRLFPFKVPLGSSYKDRVPLKYSFSPEMLLYYCEVENIKIGLWIDLTNSYGYYDKSDVQFLGCKYLKLSCKDEEKVPSDQETRAFISAVDEFMSEHPRECIGVHCTYGYNRTGYMIVSYLVERMDLRLKVALQKFAKVRPPGIYNRDFVMQLYNKYSDDGIILLPVSVPDWCDEKPTNTNLKDDKNECRSSKTSVLNSPKPVKSNKDTTHFLSDVPGVHLFTQYPKMKHLQERVHRMCGWKEGGFPGCLPLAMDINNKEILTRKPYRVSWKPEGTRCMMLIDGEHEVYLLDRDYNVFKVQGLRFVYKNNLHRHLKKTLVDGEMVIDKVNGAVVPRYLVNDIVTFDGKDVSRLPFHPTRSKWIDNELIAPRNTAMVKGLINKALEPFSVRRKEYWPIDQTEILLNEFAERLPHKLEGLIFQPAKESYVFGRSNEVLQWKPRSVNSVYFKLTIGTTNGVGVMQIGYLFVGNMDRPFAKIKYTSRIKNLDKKIIECRYERNEWKFVRERTDKLFPDSFETAKSVCESRPSPVTKDMLMDFIEQNRFNENDDVMLPPPNKRRRL